MKNQDPQPPGFFWDNFATKPPVKRKQEEEDLEEPQVDERRSKRAKKIEKKRLEVQLQQVEEALADEKRAPESIQDFERLLLASPNSSYIWIQYIAFHLSSGEIFKGRELAEKALKKINFREEREKLNVWVAYLNLEHHYGTHDTLMAVFQRAVQANEPKEIYLHLFNIYLKAKDDALAEDFFKTLLKKFRTSSKIYKTYSLYKLQQKDSDGFKNVMQIALKNLPKHKHIKIITKFAQYEYKHGSPQRGRAIFEGIVSSYPKRLDLWSVFLDQEINANDVSSIRALFDRVTNLKWSSKQMKFLLKKQLVFEKKIGHEDAIEAVKQKAIDFLRTKSSS